MLLVDFPSSLEVQEKAAQTYHDKDRWTEMSILNTARMGKSSSGRAICDYCTKIWGS